MPHILKYLLHAKNLDIWGKVKYTIGFSTYY